MAPACLATAFFSSLLQNQPVVSSSDAGSLSEFLKTSRPQEISLLHPHVGRWQITARAKIKHKGRAEHGELGGRGTGTRVCHTVGLGCPLHHSPHTDQDHPGLCPASLPVATVSMSCQLHVQLTLDSLPLSLHLHPPWPHLLRLYKSLLPHRFPSLACSIQAPHLTYELLKMKALILKLFHSSHDLPGQPTQS